MSSPPAPRRAHAWWWWRWGRPLTGGALLGAGIWLIAVASSPRWIAAGIIILLIAIYGWLVRGLRSDRRMLRAVAEIDQRRAALGGWENMSEEQRAQWLADLKRALE